MPSASLVLVIGHGGHSTMLLALAQGVPLLILPMHRLIDQQLIGEAVAGAGRVLPKTASADEIRSATLITRVAANSNARTVGTAPSSG